jgi:hypothetical protein
MLDVSGRLVLSSSTTDQIINGQRPDAAKDWCWGWYALVLV